MEYTELASLWIAYFFVHSLLAANGTKMFIKKALPRVFHYYRIVYSSISLIFLIPIFYCLKNLPEVYFFTTNVYATMVGSLLLTSGLILGYIALKTYTTSDFLGFQQMRKRAQIKGKLITSGLNQYVRHPLYFAALLGIWGAWLIYPTVSLLITNVVMVIYLIIGTKLEEQKLIVELGNAYKNYQKNVPMLVPIKLKKK